MKLSLTAGKIIGLKEIKDFLKGDLNLKQSEELIKKNIQDQDQERIIDEYLEKVVVAQ